MLRCGRCTRRARVSARTPLGAGYSPRETPGAASQAAELLEAVAVFRSSCNFAETAEQLGLVPHSDLPPGDRIESFEPFFDAVAEAVVRAPSCAGRVGPTECGADTTRQRAHIRVFMLPAVDEGRPRGEERSSTPRNMFVFTAPSLRRTRGASWLPLRRRERDRPVRAVTALTTTWSVMRRFVACWGGSLRSLASPGRPAVSTIGAVAAERSSRRLSPIDDWTWTPRMDTTRRFVRWLPPDGSLITHGQLRTLVLPTRDCLLDGLDMAPDGRFRGLQVRWSSAREVGFAAIVREAIRTWWSVRTTPAPLTKRPSAATVSDAPPRQVSGFYGRRAQPRPSEQPRPDRRGAEVEIRHRILAVLADGRARARRELLHEAGIFLDELFLVVRVLRDACASGEIELVGKRGAVRYRVASPPNSRPPTA